MTQTSKFNPKDFFLWLATMIALYVSVVSFIVLLFQYINVLFPDDLVQYYDPYSGPIRISIASLFVFFPIYVGLTRLLNQEIRKEHEKIEIGIRKWLIFLTLFVSGLTILIDLVVLVNTFLGGEITTRFILKVFGILLVFGAVFGYYVCDLRGRWEKDQKTSVRIGGIVSFVILATVIAGFFVIGSPQSAREIRLDQQRISDLQNIQWQIVNFWQLKERLPESLDEIEDPLSGWMNPRDPQTNELYEYEKTGDLTFRLCATFNAESQRPTEAAAMPVRTYGGVEENFQHGVGRECFDRTIDPERYPVLEKAIIAPTLR